MSEAPLSDVQRDALIRTMTAQVHAAEESVRAADKVIRELRAELVAAHAQIAELLVAHFPEAPFSA